MRKSSRIIFQNITLAVCVAVVVSAVVLTMAIGVFYPQSFVKVVDKYCGIYGVDKVLVMSIIRTESGFDSNASSSRGAVGLMQVMPSTAGWIGQKLDITTEIDLKSPVDNIMIGTAYLKYLTNKYMDMDFAIIAYNAGEGNLDKWRALAVDDDVAVPFAETRDYLARVKESYKVYQFMLG